MSVLFTPQVEEYLFELIEILHKKGYFSFHEYAEDYVWDIIRDIEDNISVKQKNKAPKRFTKYATHYITLRKSKRTTWYIFFVQRDTDFIITYITNNHIAGHHIRGLK